MFVHAQTTQPLLSKWASGLFLALVGMKTYLKRTRKLSLMQRPHLLYSLVFSEDSFQMGTLNSFISLARSAAFELK